MARDERHIQYFLILEWASNLWVTSFITDRVISLRVTDDDHNIYLDNGDTKYGKDHIRNRRLHTKASYFGSHFIGMNHWARAARGRVHDPTTTSTG